jgi:diacylglycerol kinase
MFSIAYWTKRFSHPLRGLWYAFRHDFAFRFEFIAGGLGLLCLYFVFGPFSPREQLLLIFCWFLIMVTELQNSAIETALDRLHPERHEAIGRSKDLAAAAVVWAGIFGCVSLAFVLVGNI